MRSDLDNLDVMIGNENINPFEKDVAYAIEQSSVQDDGV